MRDEIAEEQRAGQPNRCCAFRARADMDEADYADFVAAIDDHDISIMAIHRALAKRGVKLSIKGLGLHRRRQCACPE